MGHPWYTTREACKAALDSKATARDDARVDRAIEAAGWTIDGDTHRTFWPQLATRYWDWPNHQQAPPWRLWLDGNELVSITTLTVAGVALSPADYLLRRSDDLDEPPYDQVQLLRSGSATFGGGSTPQRAIGITGVYAGCRIDETVVGALTANLGASGTAGLDLSPTVGVGSILRIDAERLTVVDKTMVDTGQNLGAPGLAAAANDVTVPVSDGTVFDVDEIILIGAERMLVVDIAGNNLVVKRAWDGSVLAAHATGVDVYALMGFVVARGQLGTTAAAHLDAAPVYRFDPPSLIQSWAVAEATTQLLQEQSGYGRTVGSGENEREAAGRGLSHIRADAIQAFGRRARLGVI